MPERVDMWHEDVPHTKKTPANVTKKAFDLVWKDKGWKLWKPTAAKKKETN